MIALASARRSHRARGQHLHRDIPERGGFDRPGDNAPAAGVGGELIEQPVARAAADDRESRVHADAGQAPEHSSTRPVAYTRGSRGSRA